MQTSHEQVREACGRGLSRGCFALRAGSASPVLSPPAACCVSVQRALSVCWGRECRGRDSSSHPSRALSLVPVPGSLGTVKFPNTWTGWVGRAALQSGVLGNVPPWRNGTPTFSTWPRETPALLNPPLLPISIGLRGQLLQPDGLPVPPEAVWQAACRGRQARVQLPTLWQEVQIQGWPRLSRAVRTRGLGERPGRLRSPRSGAIPPRGGLQSCGARGQDRAGQGRARQGRCRRCFLPQITVRVCCTMQCWGEQGTPSSTPPKMLFMGVVSSIPFPQCPQGFNPAHPASMLCREKKPDLRPLPLKCRLLASAGVAGSIPGEHPFLFC